MVAAENTSTLFGLRLFLYGFGGIFQYFDTCCIMVP
jgi:hypothetical protein